MGLFILRRLGLMLLTALCLTFIVFWLTNLYPNLEKLAKTQGNFRMSDEAVTSFLDDRGYLAPLPIKFGRWLGVAPGWVTEGKMAPRSAAALTRARPWRSAAAFAVSWQGNWGQSTVFKDDVGGIVATRLGLTGKLMFWVLVLMVPMALLIGVLAGMREGSKVDRSLSTVSIVSTATPEYVSGVIFIAVFASSAFGLRWFKGSATSAMENANFENFFLPVLTISLYGMGYIARMTRASMTEVMTAQYIRTARLKGVSFSNIVIEARAAQRADRALHGDHAAISLAPERRRHRRDALQLQGLWLGAGAGGGQQRHRIAAGGVRGVGDRRAGHTADIRHRIRLSQPAHQRFLRRI